MKKLITMLAAVATAFGLYAADDGFLSGAGFDTTDADGTEKLTWTSPEVGFVEGYWTGVTAETAVLTTGASRPSDSTDRPARFLLSNDPSRAYNGYVTLNTGTGLVGANIKAGGDAQAIDADKGLYFDGLVQFTSYEDDMPAIDAGAKIALFPMVDNPEDDTPTSSLWISASGNSSNLWKTTKAIDDGWHRVTIKMINDILKSDSASQVGFVVYIDGDPIGTMASQAAFVGSALTPEAKSYWDEGYLFGALTGTAEMTDVAFSGKGAIDEIAFTETAPDFAESPKFFKIGWDTATVASVAGLSENPQDVLVTDEEVTYTYTAAEGYIDGTTNITGVAGETYTITAAKLGAAVYKWDETAQNWVAVEGGQVSTFAEALALVDNTGKFKIALAQDEGAITISKTGCDLTIDLAGNEIASTAQGVAAIAVSAGNLTIIDSSEEQTGVVNGYFNEESYGEALAIASTYNGLVTINAGKFNGAVSNAIEDTPGNYLYITDGLFSVAENEFWDECAILATIPEDAEWAKEEGYYYLKTVTDFTVEVPAAADNTKLAVTIDDVVAGDTNGVYTVAKASTLKAVYTADEGYELDGDGEFEVTYKTKDTVVIEAPTATILTFTLQVTDNDTVDVTVNPDEETYDWGTAVKVTVAPKTDYQFSGDYEGWDKEGNNLVSNFVIKANTEITAPTATAIEYVAQVNTEKFLTTEAALAKVQELEADPANFPITVTCLAADGFTVKYGDPEQSVTLAENETIEITADSWKFEAFSGNVVLAPGKTIKAKSIADGATINTIPGYKVVKSDTTDEGGYYTWSVVEAAYLTIKDIEGKFYSLGDAAAAVKAAGKDTIEVTVNNGQMSTDGGFRFGKTNATDPIYLTLKAAEAGDGFTGSASFDGVNADLVVDGITFIATSANHITISGTVDALFKNCTFKDETGTYNYAVAGNGTTLGARFENCVIDGYYRGFNANFGGEATIVGCTFKNMTAEDRSALQISGATTKYYIENNTFENCAGSAFMIYNNMTTGSVIVINGTTIGVNGAKYLLDDERVTSDKDLDGLKFYWGVNSIDASCDQTKAMKKGAIEDKLEEQFVTPAVSFTLNLPADITYADWDAEEYKLTDNTAKTLAEIEAMDKGTVFLVKPGYAAPAATAAYTVEPATVENCDFAYQLKTAMYDITFTDAAEWTNVVSTAYGATPAPTEQVPVKVGYTFTGWNPTIVAVEAAATYTAVYTVNQYDVTFSTNNIPVADAATKVAHGATLETSQIPTFTEDGKWDVDPATAVITCATNFNYTIQDAPAPVDPVDPGEEKSYETPEEAANAAEYINDNKETMINVPTEASGDKDAYLDLVEAKVVDGNKVVVDLTEAAEATFEAELDDEMEDADVAAALTDASATTATIETKAGFYYWIEGGVEVGAINQNGAAVIGDGKSVELTKPALGTTTKAFYKLAVGVKDPASTPVVK